MPKLILIIMISLIIIENEVAQNFQSQDLYNSYFKYKNNSFQKRRFKHSDVLSEINKLKADSSFSIRHLGNSLENREIFLVSIGTGNTNVLLWSQMHGDESTATMAIFDIFNFFSTDDNFNNIRKTLLENLTLHFIPMLNPDGAEKFERRNALDIDLNRDALRLQFPESQILKSIRDSLNPKFAFNLHDQSTRYSAGNNYESAAISFLAPAFNYEKDINVVRANTMKIIVNLYRELSNFIPGHLAKYNDDFEPRAFGDNFMKWGTSSILIESGGWKNNYEKQFIRKLNFIAILVGLQSISSGDYNSMSIDDYNKIPQNEKLLFDLLLKNLTVKLNEKQYIVDLGINNEELTDNNYNSYFESSIDDIGDLSVFNGYEEYDFSGLELKEARIYPKEFENISELTSLDYNALYHEGFAFVRITNDQISAKYTNLPINLVLNKSEANLRISYQNKANFTLWDGKTLRYLIINGFLYDCKSNNGKIRNGLIFK